MGSSVLDPYELKKNTRSLETLRWSASFERVLRGIAKNPVNFMPEDEEDITLFCISHGPLFLSEASTVKSA
jgi:hypothetical protein